MDDKTRIKKLEDGLRKALDAVQKGVTPVGLIGELKGLLGEPHIDPNAPPPDAIWLQKFARAHDMDNPDEPCCGGTNLGLIEEEEK